MVSPQNPLKPSAGLLADDARLLLARLAVEGMAGVRVTDFECHLPRPSYMVHTLAALHDAYPGTDFVLVVGADNWLRFHEWHRADEILARHDIIVYPRAGHDIAAATLPQGVQLLDAPLFPYSSTAIRHAIATDQDYRGEGLAPAVWDAIRAHGWYGYCRNTNH